MTTLIPHLLNKDENFIWDDKYQKDLENIKSYLTNAPILTSYYLERILFLYVSATLSALGAILTQKDDEGKQRVIYFTSKTLIDYEIIYTHIDKI